MKGVSGTQHGFESGIVRDAVEPRLAPRQNIWTSGKLSAIARARDCLTLVMDELQRGLVGFAGAYANNLFYGRDENLAITDLAGMRGLDNGSTAHQADWTDHHLDFYLG